MVTKIIRRFLFVVGTVLLAGSLGIALAQAQAQETQDVVAKGRKIAQGNCARCHSIEFEGASPHNDAPEFRDVAKRYSVWSLAEAFAEGITTGHPDMPEFKFNPDEINSLLSFLDTLGKKSDGDGDGVD